jgi:hypothetical protein
MTKNVAYGVLSQVYFRYISSQKIHFNKTRVLAVGTNKAGRLIGLVGHVNRIDVPTLTANIFGFRH